MDVKVVSCSGCEGTGKILNTFGPRELSIDGLSERRIASRISPPRSPSGYLLTGDDCGYCYGMGRKMELQPAVDRNVGGKSLAMRMADLIVAGAKWDITSN